MAFMRNADGVPDRERWVTGEHFGLQVPGDIEALLSGGTEFLTAGFRACGSLPAGNAVVRLEGAQEFIGGGTGKKFVMTLQYEVPGPPERLFVKFSRNFDNELWDRARFTAVPEVAVAVLSQAPDFPVAVPRTFFADIDPGSGTGLIISEAVDFGRGGVEPRHLKCADYDMPDHVGHYLAIMKGLARLSGAHKAGRLSPDVELRFRYEPDGSQAAFGPAVPESKVVERAHRMFDFMDRYPQLFPPDLHTPRFVRQFMADIPDAVAVAGYIRSLPCTSPDLIAFSHWNANVDNCWFWREPDGALRCGFLDWANAGQMNVAQAVSGALSGAEPVVWSQHLDELLAAFVEEYAAQGGPLLDADELKTQVLLGTVLGLAWSMGAPIALERAFDDIDALESYRDRRFLEHENARIQLHMMTRMLNVWKTYELGDLVRALTLRNSPHD